MSEELIRCDRKRLYREVWSEPMRHLAKKYGLSDVGLAKICARLRIPRPPRGYWAKRAAGKKVKIEPLPPAEDLSEFIVRRRLVERPPPDDAQQTEANEKVAFEKRTENRIVVPRTLDSAVHNLVEHTVRHLRTSDSENDSLLSPAEPGCLDIQVSRGSLQRAIRIMDALIKALSQRGCSVRTDQEPGRSASIEVLGEWVSFRLFERIDRVERSLTRSELKEKRKFPWRFATPKYEDFPSGMLTLQIQTPGGTGIQKSWSDTGRLRLEDRLNAFVIGLIRAAVHQRAERLAEQRRRRERMEEERRRWECQERRWEEERKVEQLNREVDAWHRAGRIRAYLDAVRRAAEEHGPIEPSSEIGRWLAWAAEYADRSDPLKENAGSAPEKTENDGDERA